MHSRAVYVPPPGILHNVEELRTGVPREARSVRRQKSLEGKSTKSNIWQIPESIPYLYALGSRMQRVALHYPIACRYDWEPVDVENRAIFSQHAQSKLEKYFHHSHRATCHLLDLQNGDRGGSRNVKVKLQDENRPRIKATDASIRTLDTARHQVCLGLGVCFQPPTHHSRAWHPTQCPSFPYSGLLFLFSMLFGVPQEGRTVSIASARASLPHSF